MLRGTSIGVAELGNYSATNDCGMDASLGILDAIQDIRDEVGTTGTRVGHLKASHGFGTRVASLPETYDVV